MTGPVYLDHNASTPIDPAVIEVMMEAMRTHYANPSSGEHLPGATASEAIERAREIIATAIGARSSEIIFCGGSTEANNLALLGAFPALRESGKTEIITSMIEHPSVKGPLARLAAEHGAKVIQVPVGEHGAVYTDAVREAVTDKTGLVSIMAANNETGILQPLDEIGALCAEKGLVFHTDYSQATAYRPLNVSNANVHLASFSGHKMYGPKGIGVLYRRLRKPRVELEPVLYGGGQERGLRSGTLNTPAIIALAAAFDLVIRGYERDVAEIGSRRDRLAEGLRKIGGVSLNGELSNALPNTISVSVDGVEPLALMRLLRSEVAFSASSACSTDRVETSPVLKAMFGDTLRARRAFRIGLGRGTSDHDIARAIVAFSRGINQLRSGRLA
ncbi:cysteine desulfurase family protein [Rhizobium sp. L1K21]|uniref:cysteine desulfurase family protein n=1 Tax=Rhizobium sp. L1K21 TaxID=2954933 RepID=UPI0020926D84|nr:cysteine desulfurase family protein [Rhizobium sp. L1K21]MCO6185212.1 cysteine desulfurase [Rhizobium sp. L1K21]